MNRSRAFVALASIVLTAAAGVVVASPAQARPIEVIPGTPAQVWVQSFQRASADEPCVAPAALDIVWQDTWNPAEQAWTATWEMWPNGGTGGWTCTRSITWAPSSPSTYW